MAKKVASKMTKKRTAKSVVAEIVDTDDSQEQSLALPGRKGLCCGK